MSSLIRHRYAYLFLYCICTFLYLSDVLNIILSSVVLIVESVGVQNQQGIHSFSYPCSYRIKCLYFLLLNQSLLVSTVVVFVHLPASYRCKTDSCRFIFIWFCKPYWCKTILLSVYQRLNVVWLGLAKAHCIQWSSFQDTSSKLFNQLKIFWALNALKPLLRHNNYWVGVFQEFECGVENGTSWKQRKCKVSVSLHVVSYLCCRIC